MILNYSLKKQNERIAKDRFFICQFYVEVAKKVLQRRLVSGSGTAAALRAKLRVVLQDSLTLTSQDRARAVRSFSTTRLGRIMSVMASLSIVPNNPATLLLYQPSIEIDIEIEIPLS